jgi:hypothetical protein
VLVGQKVLQDISAALMAPDELVRSIMQLQNQVMAPGGKPGQPGGAPGSDKQLAPSSNPAEMGQQAGQPEGQPATGPSGSDQQ